MTCPNSFYHVGTLKLVPHSSLLKNQFSSKLLVFIDFFFTVGNVKCIGNSNMLNVTSHAAADRHFGVKYFGVEQFDTNILSYDHFGVSATLT